MTALARKVRAASATPAWQLALDKFPYRLDDGIPSLLSAPDQRGNRKGVKPDRLRSVRDVFNEVSQPELNSALASRRAFLDSLERQHGTRFRRVTLVNASRLLLHLARSSVLENVGLYCDRSTGLPLIPGSAVKGVVSAWACWEENQGILFPEDATTNLNLTEDRSRFQTDAARRILGDNGQGGSDLAGGLIFLGAWPEEVPILGLDIVTPHTDAADHDRNPVPNPFLCIEPGTSWTFAILASSRLDEGNAANLLETAVRWLVDCLDSSGLGAKTASGYGRFLRPDQWKKEKSSSPCSGSSSRGAAPQVPLGADYPNEAMFKNRVLEKLDPGRVATLRSEIEILQKPENEEWRRKLIEALSSKDMKKLRQKLNSLDWFPSDWLSP